MLNPFNLINTVKNFIGTIFSTPPPPPPPPKVASNDKKKEGAKDGRVSKA